MIGDEVRAYCINTASRVTGQRFVKSLKTNGDLARDHLYGKGYRGAVLSAPYIILLLDLIPMISETTIKHYCGSELAVDLALRVVPKYGEDYSSEHYQARLLQECSRDPILAALHDTMNLVASTSLL